MTPRISVSSSPGGWIVAATLLCGIASSYPPVAAAAQSSAARELSIEMVSVLARDRTMPSLERTMSLDLEDLRLADALEKVAAEADLHLTYAKRLLTRDARITLQAERITVAEAVARVLDGTGLDLLVAPNGQAVLVRKPEPAAEPTRPEPQVGTIVGRVTDTSTGAAISSVDVLIEETEQRANTDAEGRYRLEHVAPGSYTLTASRLGYTDASRNVTVVTDEEVSADFALDVAPSAVEEIVVVGSRLGSSPAQSALPAKVLDNEQIERSGATTVAQALSLLPEVSVSNIGDNPTNTTAGGSDHQQQHRAAARPADGHHPGAGQRPPGGQLGGLCS